MPVNSKAKGDTYERKIAKKLTDWTGLKFERVPASGGLHWREDNRVYGDIVCNDPEFPLVIECKNRESWNMDVLVKGSAEIKKWWDQVSRDAKATAKTPMVIFTRNKQPDYAMVKRLDFDDVFKQVIPRSHFEMWQVIGDDDVVIMRLDDLIDMYGFKE